MRPFIRPMRPSLRPVAPILLVALTAATVLLWVRSYREVDKVWAQILPNFVVNAQLMPGQLAICCSRSPIRLPMGDGDWFSWPVDTYFAEDIPRPSNPLLGEFGFYNGGVTIPLWILVAFTASLDISIYARQLVRRHAGKPTASWQALSAGTAADTPGGTLLLRDHSLVVGGPPASTAQTAAVMQVGP